MKPAWLVLFSRTSPLISEYVLAVPVFLGVFFFCLLFFVLFYCSLLQFSLIVVFSVATHMLGVVLIFIAFISAFGIRMLLIERVSSDDIANYSNKRYDIVYQNKFYDTSKMWYHLLVAVISQSNN